MTTIDTTTLTSVICTAVVVLTSVALAAPFVFTAGYFVWMFA